MGFPNGLQPQGGDSGWLGPSVIPSPQPLGLPFLPPTLSRLVASFPRLAWVEMAAHCIWSLSLRLAAGPVHVSPALPSWNPVQTQLKAPAASCQDLPETGLRSPSQTPNRLLETLPPRG